MKCVHFEFNCLTVPARDYIRERKERKKRNNTHAVMGLFNFLFVSKTLQRMVMYILDAKFKESKPTQASLIESIGSIIGYKLGGDIYEANTNTSTAFFLRVQKYNEVL